MIEALFRALRVYTNPERWSRYQRNGMAEDFSWARSARQYALLYRSATSGASPAPSGRSASIPGVA
jgi:starch synthase